MAQIKQQWLYHCIGIAEIQYSFGVCKIDDDGDLDEIEEKPEFDLLVNTGLYVIEPKLLPLVPETAMDMTDFISRVRSNGNKVNVFPIPGTSYQDTGEWDSYSKAVEKIKKSFWVEEQS